MEFATAVSACVHCGAALSAIRRERGDSFCCRGCETVHGLLQERGWDATFNALRRSAPRGASPAASLEDDFEDLDHEPFRSKISVSLPGGAREMRFYLEGAHCAACVWLTEKVGHWVAGTESLRLDLESGVATVRIGAEGSFAQVARELNRLGYRPRVLFELSNLEWQRQEDRRERTRIGVLAAIAGNLMLFSLPLYAGLEGELARFFAGISGVLFLPALVLGRGPFFRAAWGALRRRQVGIDLPIALGTALAIGLGTLPALLGVSLLAQFRPGPFPFFSRALGPRGLASLWVAFGLVSLGLQAGWISLPGHSHSQAAAQAPSQTRAPQVPGSHEASQAHPHSHH